MVCLHFNSRTQAHPENTTTVSSDKAKIDFVVNWIEFQYILSDTVLLRDSITIWNIIIYLWYEFYESLTVSNYVIAPLVRLLVVCRCHREFCKFRYRLNFYTLRYSNWDIKTDQQIQPHGLAIHHLSKNQNQANH